MHLGRGLALELALALCPLARGEESAFALAQADKSTGQYARAIIYGDASWTSSGKEMEFGDITPKKGIGNNSCTIMTIKNDNRRPLQEC